MSSRRQSRILAMQILYQSHLINSPINTIIEDFWKNQETDETLHPFSEKLVNGTTENLDRIDAEIDASSKNWKMHRLPIIDLTILRIATYEIIYVDDIDAATSINEAIEISKSYSTQDSPKFINGVLDNIRKTHKNAKID
ncbi:transcription antitermination factor NusB [Candidatus Poribacteria bacterium]|nr:transcription antitermination factor NusB [Candidatus Poribacteria bacterium]